MNYFENIQRKLKNFVTKFYINELIKGVLLFFIFGILFFVFITVSEYILWFSTFVRTILFYLFVILEISLFVFFILIPLLKLFGFRGGISEEDAAKIIGVHFPEIKDKLLNMWQLKQISTYSELLNAGIEQKAQELQPFSFKSAVDYTKFKVFLKYFLIIFSAVGLLILSGKGNLLSSGFNRVVHYNKKFVSSEPFSFQILNKNLDVLEGESITIQVKTIGNMVPDIVTINFNNEHYFMNKAGGNLFSFTFENVNMVIDFYFAANSFHSSHYTISSVKLPIVNTLKMILDFPSYTRLPSDSILNNGNAIVPRGTKIGWVLSTQHTDSVFFDSDFIKPSILPKIGAQKFVHEQIALDDFSYSFSTLRDTVSNHLNFDYRIEIIPDEFPAISVEEKLDSITGTSAFFYGKVFDDYGLSKLQFIYYNSKNREDVNVVPIELSNLKLSEFYFDFPGNLFLKSGVSYEGFFEVFDNDHFPKNKKSVSKTFKFYTKTELEIQQHLLNNQESVSDEIIKSLHESKDFLKEIEKSKKAIQQKIGLKESDVNNFQNLLERQEIYNELMLHQSNILQENLEKQQTSEPLKDKKLEINKRIEETKELLKDQKLAKELKELSEEISKEDLMKRLDKMTKNSQQNSQSLERILELTKRFYIEQKLIKIAKELQQLSKEQDHLVMDSINKLEKQQKIEDDFDLIQEDFNDLIKRNQELKRPMNLPNEEKLTQQIKENFKNALKDIQNSNKREAVQSQKMAAQKLKELSDKLQSSLSSMEVEMIDENIEELRKIVDNLIEFSFLQEELRDRVLNGNTKNSNYASHLKMQYNLKEYFEFIDDSLYVLSLRLVQMSSMVSLETNDVHYNLDQSLINLSNNNVDLGVSNQQFVITGANNLANSLSDLLEQLMNASPNFGQGKGNSFDISLPDIIQQQGELLKKTKDGLKNQSGKSEENSKNTEQMSDELFQIYKEQAKLKSILENILGKNNGNNSNLLNKLDQLNEELLEKGLSKSHIEEMIKLNYKFLNIETAKKEQDLSPERESTTNKYDFEAPKAKSYFMKNPSFNFNEILIRQSLPLHPLYDKKVRAYFQNNKEN